MFLSRKGPQPTFSNRSKNSAQKCVIRASASWVCVPMLIPCSALSITVGSTSAEIFISVNQSIKVVIFALVSSFESFTPSAISSNFPINRRFFSNDQAMHAVYGTIFRVGISSCFANNSTSKRCGSFIKRVNFIESTLCKTGSEIGAKTKTVPELWPDAPSLEAGGILLIISNVARLLQQMNLIDD